jgi:ribonucleoside-diphosphate reductase alpha subunit
MKVLKRSGKHEEISFDKITKRIKLLCDGLEVEPSKVTQKTADSLVDDITTTRIDEISAEVAANMSTDHPDYEVLAARIFASNLQKSCPKTLAEALAMNTTIDPAVLEFAKTHSKKLIVKKERDFLFSYFGLKTMQKIYLAAGETPQYMFMRVSIGIHLGDVKEVQNTYDLLSQKLFTHATPTMINAGTKMPQMSSCFLTQIKEDSIAGIYDTLSDCAQISKHGGGIGIHAQNIRSKGSIIKGTNGHSDGIIPMCRVFNATARYVNQSGKRKGSFAMYLEPWHPDILEFLELRLNQGDEDARCRDLFTAMWIPDLFMKCVAENGTWALFDPCECPGLSDTYGQEFETLYAKYFKERRYKQLIPAFTIWTAIIKSQIETGTPYMLYKDTCNSRSNQKNLGTLKGSNLCCEILEHTSKDEIAVCNLASISLPAFVKSDGSFDYDHLHEVTMNVTKNLNKIIDRNYYPVKEGEVSNQRQRPIGIGVQGLADVYMMMGLAFDSNEASDINRNIFETIYHGALEQSVELSKRDGPYCTFRNGPLGSTPASEGLLQFDLAGMPPGNSRYDWDSMKTKVRQSGLRNSLLIAPMPTATTSQVLGNNECFEPYTTNIYLRRTLAGEFTVVNKHLVKDLQKLGLWNSKMKNLIIEHGGSVQNIKEIPDHMKSIYKTVWEISQRSIIDHARDRGAFICQSQSMNLFVEDPSIAKLSSMHMYAWKQGLKTGMYYLRTRPKVKPVQVTIEPQQQCRWEPGCQSCGA